MKWWLFGAVLVAFVGIYLAFFNREGVEQSRRKHSGATKPSVQTMIDTPSVLWWYADLFPYSSESVMTCSLGDCFMTKNASEIKNERTRAIVIYGTDFRGYSAPLPRQPHHIWALLHEESPKNNYILVHDEALEMFNITATSSRFSDFPLSSQYIPSLNYLVERQPVPVSEKNKRRKEDRLAAAAYVQTICDNPSDRDR